MREYETVYILQSGLTETDLQKSAQKWEGIVNKQEGTVFFNKLMGKKSLAYPIKKQSKGVYYCLDYTGDGSIIPTLERQMKLDENVLRFLTIIRDEKVDVEARKLEIASQKEPEKELQNTETKSAEEKAEVVSEEKGE